VVDAINVIEVNNLPSHDESHTGSCFMVGYVID
jgi:hypothetical protein